MTVCRTSSEPVTAAVRYSRGRLGESCRTTHLARLSYVDGVLEIPDDVIDVLCGGMMPRPHVEVTAFTFQLVLLCWGCHRISITTQPRRFIAAGSLSS